MRMCTQLKTKAPDVAYQDNLEEFDSIWGVKGLIVTRSNLVVTWKVRPHMGIYFFISPSVALVLPMRLYFDSFMQLIF